MRETRHYFERGYTWVWAEVLTLVTNGHYISFIDNNRPAILSRQVEESPGSLMKTSRCQSRQTDGEWGCWAVVVRRVGERSMGRVA